MPPPRKITYNGRTVCKPSDVVLAGRIYHSQFRLLGNDIVLDNQQAAIYCTTQLKMENIIMQQRVVTRRSTRLDPKTQKFHDDLCHHFLGVFHPIDSFILLHGRVFLDRLLDCMIPILRGCSFDRDIIYVIKLFKFCLIILLEI